MKKLLLLSLLFILPSLSWAKFGDCQADIAKFCSEEKGLLKINQCLNKNEEQLSETCAKRRKNLKASFKAAIKACRGEGKRLCPGVEPGQGAIHKCLKTKKDQLKPACKAAIENHKNSVRHK